LCFRLSFPHVGVLISYRKHPLILWHLLFLGLWETLCEISILVTSIALKGIKT
jgi:hypothetical protein